LRCANSGPSKLAASVGGRSDRPASSDGIGGSSSSAIKRETAGRVKSRLASLRESKDYLLRTLQQQNGQEQGGISAKGPAPKALFNQSPEHAAVGLTATLAW
jgi:hypothetical protein